MNFVGDANTVFFHSIANVRRKKKLITSQQDGDEVLTDIMSTENHVTTYYKNLFGSVSCLRCNLDDEVWLGVERVCKEDTDMVTKTFLIMKLKTI
jgi:hypothetical protein